MTVQFVHRPHYVFSVTIWLIFSSGNPVEGVDSMKRHLISASPAAAELVFQLGKGRDLVAVTQLSDYPREAKRLPTIGAAFMPSIERALRFAPDWVVAESSIPQTVFETGLRTTGIRYFTLSISSVSDLFRESERFLKTLYDESLPSRVIQWKRCAASFPRLPPFRFMVFAWLDPAFLFGHTTFLSDVITRIGGINALPRYWTLPYPQVAEEWILSHPVEVVFLVRQSTDDLSRAREKIKQWWPASSPRIVLLSPDHFARPTFTPFEHLNELDSRISPGKDCRQNEE